MSGGSLDYYYCDIERHADDIPDREIRQLTKDLANLMHDLEWYMSSDISEGSYRLTLKNFKQKWLYGNDKNIQDRIKKYVNDAVKEFRKSIGQNNECHECKFYSQLHGDDGYEYYGKCEFHKGCLMHMHDSACDRFEEEIKE